MARDEMSVDVQERDRETGRGRGGRRSSVLPSLEQQQWNKAQEKLIRSKKHLKSKAVPPWWIERKCSFQQTLRECYWEHHYLYTWSQSICPLLSTHCVAFVIAVCCSQELHSKTPLQLLVAGHREKKLEPQWKLPRFWLVYIVADGTAQAPGRELSPQLLPGSGVCILCCWCIRKEVPTGEMVTNHYLR